MGADYTFNQGYVECPYCHHKGDDVSEIDPRKEDLEFECGKCGLEYRLSVCWSATYTAYQMVQKVAA